MKNLLPVEIIKHFPILGQKIHGQPLVYLDSAASTQKPRQMLDALQNFYTRDYANIHRGAYELSLRATTRFEEAREKVQRFINAAHSDEIIFTRGATESINLIAASWGATYLKSGDEIVLTTLEHHANIVPWQRLREKSGIVLRVVPITPEGDIRLEDIKAAFSPRTKLVTVAQVSNALGTVLPIQEIARLAHAQGALILADGCQAAGHGPVDVQALGVDFYTFSGHKLYGPTGVGVLYGKREILKAMPPYQTGGDMIASVTFEKTTFKDPPHRFEAGTPAIAEVVGLGAAIDYLNTIGMQAVADHEAALLKETTARLQGIKGLHIIGTAPQKAGIISFTLDGIHPHDIATILDNHGVAVRAGHHCAQPLMDALGLAATARVSFGIHNRPEDIDALERALKSAQEIFA